MGRRYARRGARSVGLPPGRPSCCLIAAAGKPRVPRALGRETRRMRSVRDVVRRRWMQAWLGGAVIGVANGVVRQATYAAIGAGWIGLTVAFEFGFGRLVAGQSWEELLADYDVSEGRTWPFVLAWI